MNTANTLSVIAFVAVPLNLVLLFGFSAKFRSWKGIIFPNMAVVLLVLTGIAAFKDSASRDYLAIQQQYQDAHPPTKGATEFNLQVQQLFPQFNGAKVADTFRVERCISCHVPDIATVGSQVAAQNINTDFFKNYTAADSTTTGAPNEPDAATMAKDFGLTKDANGNINHDKPTSPGDVNYAIKGSATTASEQFKDPATGKAVQLPGYIQANLDPAQKLPDGTLVFPDGRIGIDQAGCVTCHNGNRLALNEADAHQNLIINPDYSWTAGATLYYANCAVCHGSLGQGDKGPPLSNQDRLGFFNEDYYYRCIEYGMTDFEHYGSIMPNWGGIAPGYDAAANPPGPGAVVGKKAVLTENQIYTLVQFIRHWESYSTLP